MFLFDASWNGRGEHSRRHTLHFPHCIQMDIHQDPSSFQPLRSPLGLRVRHSVAIFAIKLLLSFSNALSQNGVRRRLEASSTLSRSHVASHHIASHRKASHAAQLLSSSQTSRGSCTDPQYKARATTAKNHARAHAARSRYPLAHPRPHPAPRKPCPPSSARPNHHWSRISVHNFPGASREVTIFELFSEWSGKRKKWDGKLGLSFFCQKPTQFHLEWSAYQFSESSDRPILTHFDLPAPQNPSQIIAKMRVGGEVSNLLADPTLNYLRTPIFSRPGPSPGAPAPLGPISRAVVFGRWKVVSIPLVSGKLTTLGFLGRGRLSQKFRLPGNYAH